MNKVNSAIRLISATGAGAWLRPFVEEWFRTNNWQMLALVGVLGAAAAWTFLYWSSRDDAKVAKKATDAAA